MFIFQFFAWFYSVIVVLEAAIVLLAAVDEWNSNKCLSAYVDTENADMWNIHPLKS